MPTAASPTPVTPTGQSAHYLPSHDAAPVIAAQEANLAEYLNLPAREIIARLGLDRGERPDERSDESAQKSNAAAVQPVPSPAPPSQSGGFDPMGLITPVLQALGTLGTGSFGGGSDPTQAFAAISQAFDGTAPPVQQAVATLGDGWRGEASTKAAGKADAAVDNGSALSAQAAELRRSLAAAATGVGQAQTRLIGIITDFQATIAAIGPNIAFPWGWAAAVAAAAQAISTAVETMTELQSTLAVEGSAAATAGIPVAVTAAPQLASAMGPLVQLASSAVSTGTGAISSGVQAAQGQAKTAQSAIGKPGDLTAPTTGGPRPTTAGGAAGGGGAGAGGGGAALSAATTRSLAPTSAPAAETTASSAQSGPARATATGGVAATGAGGMMGGAPMHGAGKAALSGHDAPSFLHTSDQGDEIVGDLGTVAPPVIGEVDSTPSPDIELRI